MTAANEALSTDTPATVTFDTLKAAQELRKTGFEDRQSVDSRFEKVALRFDALENRIILKLGGLIVTMTFLLLAIGPFYFRWVLSLMGSS